MQQIFATLEQFPGEDRVYLTISEASNSIGTVTLDMPGLSVNYCPHLHQQLVEMVGEDGIDSA